MLTVVRIAFILLIALGINSSNSFADDKFKGTILHLTATETKEVEEDLLIANMRFEFEHKKPREVQNAINKKMKEALEKARKIDEVKISTEHYNIHRYYPNRRNSGVKEKEMWRGSQSLMLKSDDADKLLKLAGEFQDIGLLMSGLTYTVSPDKREKIKDGLLEKAITKLKSRASRAAKAIGKDKFEFAHINVNDNNHYPAPLPRNYAMRADMAGEAMSAPVAAPGQSRVSLSVSVTVRIKD